MIMIKSYLHNHINEGFDVLGRKILLNPRHNLMLDTRLSGEPVKYTIYSNALQKDIEVYSVFKRVELLDSEKKQIGLKTRSNGDSNPVIYSLKKENGWGFLKKEDEEQFWKIFEHILRKWLREHKNQYDTVVMVPSSSHINKNIIEMIQKLSEEVGIGSFITKGLIKMTTSEVEDMASDYDSYFYKYWSARNKFDEAFEKLQGYLEEMDYDTDSETGAGTFTYHFISDMNLRTTVIDTIKWDPKYKDRYKKELNDTNVLIVDDSITHGISIDSTLKAISNYYNPASVSVLTMFSKLYNASDGKIIESKEDIPDWLIQRIDECRRKD